MANVKLNEKIDEILSRLTYVEDGMEKLKMEVTKVKMEVNNIDEIVMYNFRNEFKKHWLRQ